MLVQFSVAAGLIAATITLQALFMSAGLSVFRRLERDRPALIARNPTIATVIWVLFLMLPIVLDVVIWAIVYHALGTLPSLEESLYFSTVTFTTVGYGDIVLGREWRQLATFEAMNGWIVFGWATALIMAFIQRVFFRFELSVATA